MKNNKACGPDGIPAEILKFGDEKLANRLNKLISKIWHDKYIPPDLIDANIVTIYKKGDKLTCWNYRALPYYPLLGRYSLEFS